MAWQSLFYCCVARVLMRPVRILVFVQTALALVLTYSDSLRAIADGVAISFLLLCRSGAYARTYHIHWIATVAMLPRDDKE